MPLTESTDVSGLDILHLQSEFVCATQIVEFIGHQELHLARLVEGILTAQGYQVLASPFGETGSVHISAAGGIGPLGFSLPSLSVLVRPIREMDDPDVDDLKSFAALGGAENALFASWLYFSDETTAEARNLFQHAEFWDVCGIIRAFIAKYENMSDELKAYLPLKRIWILDRSKLG